MTKLPSADISRQISEIIRKKGLTLHAFARGAGVDAASLCRFMKGQQGLSDASLGKVLAFLGYRVKLVRDKRDGEASDNE